jgi:HEXXH motif-containing protein
MLLASETASVERRSQGLGEFLHGWLSSNSGVDFNTTWDLAFGRVLRALESPEVDPVDVLAEVGLRLAARGQAGNWSASLREQRCLTWDNRWLLPKSTRLSVVSAGTVAEVRTDDSACTFRHAANGWQTEDAEQLLSIGNDPPFALIPPEATPQDMISEDDFHSIFEFPAVTLEMARPFSEALTIIAEYAPEYRSWVERVLRGILICRCNASRTRSSSWMHAPGMVLISWSANPIEIAEMMVHECSHQYYYVVSKVADVVDGSDKTLHYSPAVQRKRPLSKILVGYHAFANILLFYRTLLTRGFSGDGYCHSIEARLTSEVAELERPLRDNPALTSAGLDLCQPLMELLHERRVAVVS